jgi:hypothetical protein
MIFKVFKADLRFLEIGGFFNIRRDLKQMQVGGGWNTKEHEKQEGAQKVKSVRRGRARWGMNRQREGSTQ